MTELASSSFAGMFAVASTSLFRLETRRRYKVPEEQPLIAAWRKGEPIEPPSVPWYQEWLDSVAVRTRAGFTVTRVRIMDSPPTDYQAYNAWAGRWNEAAGEDIRYITRHEAETIGVPDSTDWWMFDGDQVVELVFGGDDELAGYKLIDPAELGPYRVVRKLCLSLVATEREAS